MATTAARIEATRKLNVQQRAAHEPRPPGDSLQLQLVRAGDTGREDLEAYVRARFAAKHGAEIRTFMPTLIAFRERHGELRGVAGMCGAHESRLYLEQYLDRPIEERLTTGLRSLPLDRGGARTVRREEIVEVGNLAGASCRAAVRMVAQLPVFLLRHRYSWIVFTATSALHRILQGFGAPLLDLGRAAPSSVATAADVWGRYYESDSRVFAGYLPDADQLAGFAHRMARR